MADTPQVLLVCSSSKAHHGVTEAFKRQGIRSVSAFTVRDAESILRDNRIGLVISSSELLDGGFQDILRFLQRAELNVPVLVISRTGESKEREEAKRMGAVECVSRPLNFDDIEAITQLAIREITSADKRELH